MLRINFITSLKVPAILVPWVLGVKDPKKLVPFYICEIGNRCEKYFQVLKKITRYMTQQIYKYMPQYFTLHHL